MQLISKGTIGSGLGAKVSLDVVCRPRDEGGLGLKKLEDWNIASVAHIVWILFRGSETLLIAWVEKYLLKGKSFWTVKLSQTLLGGGRRL